ncbi:MAG: HlyD family efflux transporter periplasmic adaptor subunit [Planctomycetota bacterium]
MTQQHFDRPGSAEQTTEISEILLQLSHFQGPPEQFLLALLTMQCRLAGATQGALLRVDEDRPAEPLAVHPAADGQADAPAWLAMAVQAAPRVAKEGKTACLPIHGPEDLYGDPPRRSCLLLPIRRPRQSTGIGAFCIDSVDQKALAETARRLELSAPLLQLYEMRINLQRSQNQFAQMRQSVEILAAVNRQGRFLAAAMALCNEVAQRFGATRVGLGLLKGRTVRVRAMSETEKIDRKTEDLQCLEAAMEECLDQDIEISCPASDDAPAISRAAEDLSRHGSLTSVLSLPLRHDGQTVGVLTCQRDVDKPFTPDQIALLRLTCELTTPRIIELSQTDRWVGARLAGGLRKAAAAAVGSQHTWLKLLAIGLGVFLAFAFVARGTRTAEGNFTVLARKQTELPAPFSERLIQVHVKPGDRVVAGDLLAEMRTDKIEAALYKARAEEAIALRKYSAYLDAEKRSDAEIARLEARQAQARIKLYEGQLADARIVAPVDGEIIEGDWQKFNAPPVELGQQLFVIAPAEQFEAELLIPENRIIGVQVGSTGQLASTGRPDQKIDFTVKWVSPVAELVGQENVFRVRAELDRQPEWLRHGIEGVAKVHLGRARYAEIWTAPIVDWVRMKLWW